MVTASARRKVGVTAEARVARMKAVAALLDNRYAVPGLGVRVGLDPILGLIPIWGDLIAAVGGLYIIYEARKLGAEWSLVGLMLINLALDTLLGLIPIVGDLFDFAFRANTRNLKLMGIDPD